MSPCIGTIEGPKLSGRSAWERAVVVVDVYNPSDEDSSRESSLTSDERKPGDEASDLLPPYRPRRVKGMPRDDHDSHPRMSWVELEQEYYYPKKPDSELASNATRVFKATGNRRHVLGIYVHGMKVRFCLYDHAGTIYTTPLDLRSDAQPIIAAFISLSFLDAFHLGLEPYLASKSPTSPSTLLQGGANYVIEVDGVYFRTGPLLHAGDIFGRATTVYEANFVPSGSSNAANIGVPSRVALKMSWQTPTTRSEDELLRHAEECGVQGVARLYRSAVTHRVSEGFRSKLVPPAMYADRELRIQIIGPLARPLYEVSDIEVFKTAFRSLVASAPLPSTDTAPLLTQPFKFTMTYSRKQGYFTGTSVSAI
jgi:hypothetical protein